MSDLRDLYREQIRDHSKSPRNFGRLEEADRQTVGHNPLCGDKLTLFLKLDGDKIEDIRFQGEGCAISTASASMMTTALKGKTLAEAEHLFADFHDMVASETEPDEAKLDELGKLAVFSGVRDYPARVKCASLAWHTLHAAIEARPEKEMVSTE